MNLVRFIILSLGLFMLPASVIASQSITDSTSRVEVEQSVFDTLSKELIYKTKRKLLPKEFKQDEPEIPKSKLRGSGFGFGGGFVQAIGYLLIAGLALFILYFLVSGIKIKPAIDTSEIELNEVENIEEIDAISGYDEALKNGNYRLALRMQFIKVLQTLSIHDLIHWKPDKTNRHYLNETKGTDIHSTFRSLAQTYEWVWYGNSAIGKETFDQFNVQFESFNKLDSIS